MPRISRRSLLASGTAGSLLLLAGSGKANATGFGPFTHGVASGDPAATSVLLWTRAMGVDDQPIDGRWQVATDAAFLTIVAQGAFTATPGRDHTVKVIASGLQPASDYYYRFLAAGAVSPVGRTRTLATGGTKPLDIALACCNMYMLGEFHGYRAIAAQPKLDVVLFVGDYIYEYGAKSFATSPDIRVPAPSHDTVTLADYRARYAHWRADPALQAAHARAPWICMWDDHEIANDDWMGGAQHHDPAKQGPWERRKAAAIEAYMEWMPIRDHEGGDRYAIERSFTFGDLATLILPETRLEARDQQLTLPHDLDYRIVDHADPDHPRQVVDAGLLASLNPLALPPRYKREPDIAGFRAKMADPARRMVGDRQLGWIRSEMEQSVRAGRPWVLFGSPTIMASYNWPDLNALVPQASKDRFEALQPGGSALYAMTGHGLPLFNLDSWDGYAAERERVFDIFEASKANILVLSGDSHMAWINELHHHGRQIAVEVSATTITGPSMGEIFLLHDAPVGEHFAKENRDVRWCDPLSAGFIMVHLTPEEATAQFMLVPAPRRAAPLTKAGKRVRTRLTGSGPGPWQDA